jgi:hypothetical protein
MIKDVPYFPLYAANILASKSFRLMTLEQRGLWITIQMECWVNGSVPSDLFSIAKYLGIPLEEIKRSLTSIQMVFLENRGDTLISPELEAQRQKFLDGRIKQSLGGKDGANRKKAKKQLLEKEKLEGIPKGEPEGSLSYINSSSINSNQLINKEFMSEENKAWVKELEDAPDISNAYYKASRG